jgi:D-alanyl-D-alanine carboxypeptidase (penicillin-binding protein 5/6)
MIEWGRTHRRSVASAISALAVLLSTASWPCPAQSPPAEPKVQPTKAQSKESSGERGGPPPEIVNSEALPKQPADSLTGPPFVTAKAWAIADGRTGAVLWGHREAEALEIASTTKIMTALVVLRQMARDHKVRNEMVTFSKRADRTIGSTSDVREGERLPVHELLYGLLLPSGNDAAVALAEHFGGRMNPPAETPAEQDSLLRFVAEMNRTASVLGLSETHFVNPNGLPAAGHHSSARDLARLARCTLADPDFAAIVSTVKHGCAVLNAKGERRNVVWSNTNRLLGTEGYDGVKTGTTQAAGNCLVASGRRGGDHLIVVVLGASSSDGRYADARNLFRWGWLMRGRRPAGGRAGE